MAELSVMDALASFAGESSWNCGLLLICVAGVLLACGAVQSVMRFLTVLAVLPLLVLTTVLNYRLRCAGREILPLDFLKYFQPQNRMNTGEGKNKSDAENRTRIF